jgi:hypothetical protein
LTDLQALMQKTAQPFAHRQAHTRFAAGAALAVRPLPLKRALAILLDNAVKYGGGEIACNSGRMETGHLCGADRGAGIPAAQREAAKRPFMRLARAQRCDRVRLGIAIVERAARLHGGKLQLEDRAGGGLRSGWCCRQAGCSPAAEAFKRASSRQAYFLAARNKTGRVSIIKFVEEQIMDVSIATATSVSDCQQPAEQSPAPKSDKQPEKQQDSTVVKLFAQAQ